MKFKTSFAGVAATVVAIAGLSFMLISWDYSPDKYKFAGNQQKNDTIPPPKIKIENPDVNIDLEIKNAMQEVEKALKEFDASKIQAEISKALKEADMEKMKAELDASLAKIDGEKIKAEIEKALKDIDFEKIKAELKESLEKVDMEKIKRDLDMKKLKEELKGLKKELEKLGPEIKESLQKAKVELEKAGEELKAFKDFIDGLEQDGLISKKDDYSIVHKDGDLIINDVKQPKTVYKKYRTYLDKHKSFEINNKKKAEIQAD